MTDLDIKLINAEEQARREGSLTPLIKEELWCKIQVRRMSEGLEELKVDFTNKSSAKLRPEEEQRVEKRKVLNRAAAARCRQKRKAREADNIDAKNQLESRNFELREQIKSLENEICLYRERLAGLGVTFIKPEALPVTQFTAPEALPVTQFTAHEALPVTQEHVYMVKSENLAEQPQMSTQQRLQTSPDTDHQLFQHPQQQQVLDSQYDDSEVLSILAPLLRPCAAEYTEGKQPIMDIDDMDTLDFYVAQDHEVPM